MYIIASISSDSLYIHMDFEQFCSFPILLPFTLTMYFYDILPCIFLMDKKALYQQETLRLLFFLNIQEPDPGNFRLF